MSRQGTAKPYEKLGFDPNDVKNRDFDIVKDDIIKTLSRENKDAGKWEENSPNKYICKDSDCKFFITIGTLNNGHNFQCIEWDMRHTCKVGEKYKIENSWMWFGHITSTAPEREGSSDFMINFFAKRARERTATPFSPQNVTSISIPSANMTIGLVPQVSPDHSLETIRVRVAKCSAEITELDKEEKKIKIRRIGFEKEKAVHVYATEHPDVANEVENARDMPTDALVKLMENYDKIKKAIAAVHQLEEAREKKEKEIADS